MNPYMLLASSSDAGTAQDLRDRLTDWHDAMVRHERRLRRDQSDERCHEECPHADARLLWAEAVAVFGRRAGALTFLQSRAAATADAARRARLAAERSDTARVAQGHASTRLPDTGASSSGADLAHNAAAEAT